MPRTNYSDITVILDRSGSMSSIAAATIEGFNGFVNEQKAVPGDGCWSLCQFDTEYEVVFTGMPQEKVPLLTHATFKPRGGTALVDAVCRTIDQAGARFAAMPESDRPSRVLMVIITDGEENSSRQFNMHHLSERISHQRDRYGWTFVFLGANQDAIATAAKYGIPGTHAVNFAATSEGTRASYAAVSKSTRLWKLEGNPTADQLFVDPTPDVQVDVTVRANGG